MKLMIIKIVTALSFLATGIIIAINIAYKATERQLTILAGRILPKIIPSIVPKAHNGEAIDIAP